MDCHHFDAGRCRSCTWLDLPRTQQLSALEERGQVVFRYCDPEGNVTGESNPNGSARNIAGICSEKGNVLGMMPHPERCAEEVLGSADGRRLFDAMAAGPGGRSG